ncbi:ATP5O, partial [Cervus elaphus hippelaphus]
VRCFSTSVVRPFAKLVRPPVQIYGIEGRYATALYSAASKQNKLEQVEKELLRVGLLFYSQDVREDLLAENGRLNNTPAVISAFSTMMSVHRGEVPCTVTTASPLDEATLTELKTVLKSFLSKGQVLKLEVKIDPSIMGGMIVRIGEKYVDMSAKTKIQKLSRAMREIL